MTNQVGFVLEQCQISRIRFHSLSRTLVLSVGLGHQKMFKTVGFGSSTIKHIAVLCDFMLLPLKIR
jgi:hypothetical protein